MRAAKKGSGKGGRVEGAGLGKANFAVGSAKSRAAARMLAGRPFDSAQGGQGRPGGGPERFEFIHCVHARWIKDVSKPEATPWRRVPDGRLFRNVYIPAGMDVAEGKRILDGESEEE